VGNPEQLAEAFLPNPAMNIAYTADVDTAAAEQFATSFLAPGSTVPIAAFVADILATDGAARSGLLAGIGEGRFADEVAIVGAMERPIAVLQGAGEQLVSLDYLRTVPIPSLWHGEVQVLPGAGHAPHVETPKEFAELLGRFLAELD